MKVVNKLKVIRVTVNGDVGYLCSESCFGPEPSWSPFEATNYYGLDDKLQRDINVLVLPGDEVFARSGRRVDSIEVVEFDVILTEISATVGREPAVYKGK